MARARNVLKLAKGLLDKILFCIGGPLRWVGVKQLRVSGVIVDVCSPRITNQTVAGLLWGRYELAEKRLIVKFIDGKYPIVELGGSIGFISSFLGRRFPLTPRSVVEADNGLIELLQSNLSLNRISSTRVQRLAIDYSGSQHVYFSSEDGCSLSGRITGERGLGGAVPTVQLKGLVEGFEKYVLICDIEGGEIDMMVNEGEEVRSRCHQAVIEFHQSIRQGIEWTPQVAALKFSLTWGMKIVGNEGDVWVFSRPTVRHSAGATNFGPSR